MEKNFKRELRLLLIVISFSGVWSRLYAMEKDFIKAEHQKTLTYQKELLEKASKAGYITYQGQIYVSIDELCDLLGMSYQLEGTQLSLLLERAQKDIEALIYTTYERAVIESIDEEEEEVTLRLANAQDGETSKVFSLTPESKITHKEKATIFPIEALQKGMCVDLITQLDQVKEGHPTVKEIIIQESEEETRSDYLAAMIIREVHPKQDYLIVETKDKKTAIIVYVDNYTNIRDQDNGELVIKDLKKGMEVDIRTNHILTDSTPPQTMGLEVLIKSKKP